MTMSPLAIIFINDGIKKGRAPFFNTICHVVNVDQFVNDLKKLLSASNNRAKKPWTSSVSRNA